MNTFDVFDTVIARRYITSHSIWEQLSTEFNLVNFKHDRPKPDDGTRSFSEIYDQLVINGSITANLKQQLMQREIELEIANCYPIQENLDKIQNGDTLISDMYLPAHVILQMVRSAGLEKQVDIYQSNRDKGTGKIWAAVKKNPPQLHIGDNILTDYQRPMEHGISCQLYQSSNLSEVEQMLFNYGLVGLAALTREVRLRNAVYNYRDYFYVSNQYNLPWLFIVMEMLSRYNLENITFLGRDCQLLWKLYNAYYGTAYYLPFSRKLAYSDPSAAARYLNRAIDSSHTLIDISSTGETWALMNKKHPYVVKCVIYSDSDYRPYLPNSFSYITKNSLCGNTNLVLEIMNCADHGMIHCVDFSDTLLARPQFGNHEFSLDLVKTIHKPVTDALTLSNIYSNSIRKQMASQSNEFLHDLFTWLVQKICSRFDLANQIQNFLTLEHDYHQEILTLRKNYNE